jgi:hypothetical protein
LFLLFYKYYVLTCIYTIIIKLWLIYTSLSNITVTTSICVFTNYLYTNAILRYTNTLPIEVFLNGCSTKMFIKSGIHREHHKTNIKTTIIWTTQVIIFILYIVFFLFFFNIIFILYIDTYSQVHKLWHTWPYINIYQTNIRNYGMA